MISVEKMLENKASFSDKIIQFAKKNELSLLDGVTEYCRLSGIEMEDVVSLLTTEFKAMLHKEAVDLNMFRNRSQKIKFDD